LKSTWSRATSYLRRLPASKYPDGLIKTEYLGEKSPRYFFYGWLADRRNNGLENTIGEFTGKFDGTPGIDEYLDSAWPGWDKVRFIVGYIRYGETDTYGHDKVITEYEGDYSIIPGVLRMTGIPANLAGIEPIPAGAMSTEWAVGLPGDVAAGLIKKYPDVVLGPDYTFGLYNVSGGLARDGVKEIGVLPGPIGSSNTVIWKKD